MLRVGNKIHKPLFLRSGGLKQQPSSFRAFSATVENNDVSSAAAAASSDSAAAPPVLKKIPSLPFLGSQVSLYSGIPSLASQMNNTVGYFRNLHKEYGPFYTMGIPGFGNDLHGTVYVVRDPQEMLKVIKGEGSYPSGLVEQEWPTIEWMKHANYSILGLFEQGEEWKRLRSFLQKDLLSPQAARGYLPYILQGAQKASRRFQNDPQEMAKDLNRFTSFCSADMFTGVLFGVDDNSDDEFVESAIDAFEDVIHLFLSPTEMVLNKVGITTPTMKKFWTKTDHVSDLAQQRIQNFLDKGEDNLTEEEKTCYLVKAIQRQALEDSNVTKKEVMEMCIILMIAAVETTSAKTSWNLLQLALHPEIQDELRQQIETAVEKHGGGELTAEVLDHAREDIPLLNAVIRETHRCTPAIFESIIKPIATPVEVNGVSLPAGTTVMFDSLTNMMNPDLVEDPQQFQPQRWFKDAVQARKDTPAAIIDHPFYSGPFSQGARRCPGSRVANLEVQAILARLLLDYKIQGPDNNNMHWSDVPSTFKGMSVPDFSKLPDIRLVSR